MFSSLEEQIAATEQVVTTPARRVLRYVGLLVLSSVVFAGLYVAIRLLE